MRRLDEGKPGGGKAQAEKSVQRRSVRAERAMGTSELGKSDGGEGAREVELAKSSGGAVKSGD